MPGALCEPGATARDGAGNDVSAQVRHHVNSVSEEWESERVRKGEGASEMHPAEGGIYGGRE